MVGLHHKRVPHGTICTCSTQLNHMKMYWSVNRMIQYKKDTVTPVDILLPVSRRLTVRILDLLSSFFHIFINLVGYYYYSLDVWPKVYNIDKLGYIIIIQSIQCIKSDDFVSTEKLIRASPLQVFFFESCFEMNSVFIQKICCCFFASIIILEVPLPFPQYFFLYLLHIPISV